MLAVEMESVPPQQHTLEWHIASYTVPAARRSKGHGHAGHDQPQKSGTNEASGTRTILQGLAGRAVGGELIAVMGPSGAFPLATIALELMIDELIHLTDRPSARHTHILTTTGAGKTTLLECVALRNRGFEGSVHYDGKPCTGRYVRVS